MSSVDPVGTLLADLDRPATPRVEFVDELRGRLLREVERAASARLCDRSTDHPAAAAVRAGRSRPIRRAGGNRGRDLSADSNNSRERPSEWCAHVLRDAGTGQWPGSGRRGRLGRPGREPSRVWQCPHARFCGEPTSVAWSPDGRRLAITLVEYGARSTYPALHIVDLATRIDRPILAPVARHASGESLKAYEARIAAASRSFGCFNPESVAWSPDGKQLAYACGQYGFTGGDGSPPTVWLVNADGSNPRRLRTGTFGAAWPTWSPDGREIAFSTSDFPAQWSGIYVINLDGTHRRLLAHGVGPVWSPRGDTIAYRSNCGGIRLVTPAGKDATRRTPNASCRSVGPRGWPVWSPDGRTIAIATDGGGGLYEVRADGTHLRLITLRSLLAPSGAVIRPAWRPGPAPAGRGATTDNPNL